MSRVDLDGLLGIPQHRGFHYDVLWTFVDEGLSSDPADYWMHRDDHVVGDVLYGKLQAILSPRMAGGEALAWDMPKPVRLMARPTVADLVDWSSRKRVYVDVCGVHEVVGSGSFARSPRPPPRDMKERKKRGR